MKIGNKIIKINKYNYKKDYYGEFSNKDYSLIFFENFLSNFDYREYNLETGEITFYLQNYNDIIQEKEEIILNEINLNIIIFFIVIFCIVFTVFINYNKIIKNNYFKYFNNLNNDILL